MTFQRVSFDITNACNLTCAHCLRFEKDQISHFPIDLFEKILKQIKRYDTKVIIFTGGEPFLHPHINDMADMIASMGYHYYLVTNGTQIDKLASLVENEKRRKHLLSISFSLEGATEETCDAIRGKGVYRKVMKATSFLNQKKLKFGYKMSVNKLNFGEIDKYLLDASKLGAQYVEFSHMHPTPELLSRGMILPRNEWSKIDAKVNAAMQTYRMPVVMCTGGHCPTPFSQCASIRMDDIHIDYRGNLSLCCILPYVKSTDTKDRSIAGNLADMDVWDAHEKLISLISAMQKSKIEKIGDNTFSDLDHYPCLYCLNYYNKLTWLEDFDFKGQCESKEPAKQGGISP